MSKLTIQSAPRIFYVTSLAILFLTILSCNEPDKSATTTTDSTLTTAPVSTEWLRTLYVNTIDSNLFNTESLQIVYFKQLNDSTTYCLFQMNDELCSSTFLATQVNRKNKQVRQVEEDCDGDFSQPEYSYSDYKYDTLSNTFVTTEYKETAKPEYLIVENGNKRFREGYDMDNAKTTLDSMVVTRKVLPNGMISESSK